MGPNKAFLILLLSFVVALVGLTTVFMKAIPLMLSHAVYVCQETFSNIIFSISHSVSFLLITLVITTLLIGAVTLIVQVYKTRTYIKRNLGRKVIVPLKVRNLIEELGLRSRVDIVKDNNKFSFCYRLFHPRICLSTGFLETLDLDELKAVLLHESYHLKSYDPLKIVLGRTTSVMFFFIPILRDFQNFHAFSKEIAADKLVIKNGYKQSLISTLSKLLIAGSPKFSGVAALGNIDDLEKRILYLTDNQKGPVFRPSIFSISLSAFIVLFSMALVNTPVYSVKAHEGSMDHPLFICPFGDRCTSSCRIKEKEDVNYSQVLMYTPATYTPK